ncbi:hypothetical protein N665_0538s0026 [Sinapis alba]|nr:hypothetical protein N665_0538s0026 [Sinapis alba]
MDLFKSVLPEFDHHHQQQQPDSPESTQSPLDDTAATSSSPWNFGNLIKTLATKSESVIGSYRREFEELGSELKKESSVIRQAASRAVKDLPGSFDIGASVAQESLESVGQAIDDIGATVWKSTAKIISHGKDSLLSSPSHLDSSLSGDRGLSVKPYSRFEMQLRAIQSDKATYVREPDDLEGFEKWSLGFKLEEKADVIGDLINENKAVKEMYEKIVPMEVDAETFWRRYYYKVHKLEEVEEARVKLVKRAISGGQEEEDLSWDLDDDDDEVDETLAEKDSEGGLKNVVVEEEEKVESSRQVSSKDSDISVISTQPSLPEVEDLGWDQMEDDIGSNEEKSDWPRRVSVAEEEEDLTWDIEDDDHSVKQ